MNKAILVIDMPDNCNDCTFCYYSDGKIPICFHTNFVIDEPKGTPEWCFLKPMPRMKFTYVNYDDDATANYNRGWNDCLKKIKGE